MMATWGLLIPLLLGVMGMGLGYPTGAPASVCTTMLPGHRKTFAMDTESPYRLEVDASTVVSGGVIAVSITSTGSERFRGFLLLARWANDSSADPVGLFTVRDASGGVQSVTCGIRDNSALTHSNGGVKRRLTAVWRAPLDDVGQVHFIATVVQRFSVYWVGIVSPPVTITKRPPGSTRGYSTVAHSTALETTPFTETAAAVSTMESIPSTTGETQRETDSITIQSETSPTHVDYSSSSAVSTPSVYVSTKVPEIDSSTVSSTPRLASITHIDADISTPFESLDSTSAQSATTLLETALSTRLQQTSPSTPLDEIIFSTTSPTVEVTTHTDANQSIVSTAVPSSATSLEVSTTKTHLASTASEVTPHSGTVTDDDTASATLVSTTLPSDGNTPTENETTIVMPADEASTFSPHLENTTVVLSYTTDAEQVDSTATSQFHVSGPQIDNQTDASTVTSGTSTASQDTTVLPLIDTTRPTSPLNTTITENSTFISFYNDSTTQSVEMSSTMPVPLSTLMELSTTPSDSTSTLMEPSTLFLDGTSTNTQNDASTKPSTDTYTTPSVDAHTSMYNASTTYPFNTSTTLSSPTAISPVNTVNTLSTNASTPSSNATLPVETSTTPSTQTRTADIADVSTVIITELESTGLSTTSWSPSPSTTDGTEETELPTELTTVSTTTTTDGSTLESTDGSTIESTDGSTIESTDESTIESTDGSTIESTDGSTIESTDGSTLESTDGSTLESTDGSTLESTDGSTIESTDGSTSESTMESRSLSTIPAAVTSTERLLVSPGITTPRTVTERANEIRMRLRIVSVIFTEDLRDPNSESFRNLAGQVVREISDLYRREGVTTVTSVTVQQITRGSVVPEVQILSSETLDATTKSAWIGVVYNEVHSNGRLGNFSVSDVSAVASDGTFTVVDPCFLLPCPASMVCFVHQSRCLSSCYRNVNYCLNNGMCAEPTENEQLVSCRCTANYGGERCDVKNNIVPPAMPADNSNLVVAGVWGSIGSACLVFIVIGIGLLYRNRRKKRQWRHTAKLMGSTESGLGPSGRAQMDSYAQRLTSVRAGVLIDLANISISGSEGESTGVGRLSRAASFSDAESVDQPRFIDGGVHLGGMPDILQCASTADYEMDFMNRPLSQKRKSVSFNDVTEMIDFVAMENFTLGSKEGADKNFQVRWDFQVDRSDSRETDS